MLNIESVSVNYGALRALRKSSLTARRGAITALIGLNGAGKTTLLKALMGIVPHEGEIAHLRADGKPLRQVRVGYVPQWLDMDADTPMSVCDLVTAATGRFPVWLGATKATRARARRVLAATECEGLLERRLGALSGGELQRVLLALALEPMPNILILDEPLSGVDVEGMTLLMDMLDEIRKKFDLSILMTTHDFSMLERYCDQVVLLQGKILRRGTPLDVLSSDEFAKAFHMGGGAQA